MTPSDRSDTPWDLLAESCGGFVRIRADLMLELVKAGNVLERIANGEIDQPEAGSLMASDAADDWRQANIGINLELEWDMR